MGLLGKNPLVRCHQTAFWFQPTHTVTDTFNPNVLLRVELCLFVFLPVIVRLSHLKFQWTKITKRLIGWRTNSNRLKRHPTLYYVNTK